MRALLVLAFALLAGCVSAPAPDQPPKPILENLRLTLDLRYPMGQTLSMDTRVSVICGRRLITTRLSECGMTPGSDFVRFTTGGLVQPGMRCQVLTSPPGEPSQVFEFDIPSRPKALGVWLDWMEPTAQIVSPMPAQALMHQPGARQPIAVPKQRRFGIRCQLTAWNSPVDPKAN